MTESIVKTGGTLAERLEEKMMAQAFGGPAKGVLLLDISGSMSESTGDPQKYERKIDALRKIVKGLNPERTFAFSDQCYELPRKDDIPEPWTDTRYGNAFDVMHQLGIKELVMITDGQPNDFDYARQRIVGLRVEFLYVGPQPRPAMLDQLAQLCGGSVASGSLAARDRLKLVQKIRGLLT